MLTAPHSGPLLVLSRPRNGTPLATRPEKQQVASISYNS